MQYQNLSRFPMVCMLVTCFIFITQSLQAGGVPEAGDITGVVWKWQHTVYSNDQQSAPVDSSRYTVIFHSDGTLNIQADCNRGGGSYAAKDKNITLEVTHTTRAMCPEDSRDQTFIKDMNAAKIYFFINDDLYMDLAYDTGTMKFGR